MGDYLGIFLKLFPQVLHTMHSNGWTTIHLAAKKGHSEIVKIFLPPQFSHLHQNHNKQTS